MGTKSLLVNAEGIEIHTGRPWKKFFAADGSHELLIIEDYVRAHSVFKTATVTAIGTVNILTPVGNQSYVITDIMFSARKVNTATMSLVFDDDTNSETLFTVLLTSDPVTFTWDLKGRMQSWRGARLDLVNAVANATGFVTVVYMILPDSLTFSDWDALR